MIVAIHSGKDYSVVEIKHNGKYAWARGKRICSLPFFVLFKAVIKLIINNYKKEK